MNWVLSHPRENAVQSESRLYRALTPPSSSSLNINNFNFNFYKFANSFNVNFFVLIFVHFLTDFNQLGKCMLRTEQSYNCNIERVSTR